MIANPQQSFSSISTIEPWGEGHFPAGLSEHSVERPAGASDQLQALVEGHTWAVIAVAVATGLLLALAITPSSCCNSPSED